MNSFDSIQWRCHFHQLFIRRLRLNTSTLFRQILCVVIYVYARKVFSFEGSGWKGEEKMCTIVARDVPANVTGSVSMLPRSIDFINASIPCTVYIQRRTLLCWNSSTKKKHRRKRGCVCLIHPSIGIGRKVKTVHVTLNQTASSYKRLAGGVTNDDGRRR
jgi:hypothetical protein